MRSKRFGPIQSKIVTVEVLNVPFVVGRRRGGASTTVVNQPLLFLQTGIVEMLYFVGNTVWPQVWVSMDDDGRRSEVLLLPLLMMLQEVPDRD